MGGDYFFDSGPAGTVLVCSLLAFIRFAENFHQKCFFLIRKSLVFNYKLLAEVHDFEFLERTPAFLH